MLPPVLAISNAGVTSQKQAAAMMESLADNTVPANGVTVALSGAISASVEGKLNMLLAAARDRMIDSLLAVIDAVSRSVERPQEADESKTAFAMRLSVAIRDLTPKQIVAVQQQLNAQGKAIPLQMIAQALHDPTGPEAAQIVAYLEVVRYRERDLATKAVVSSYGQNGGNAEPAAASKAPAAKPVLIAADTEPPAIPEAASQAIADDTALAAIPARAVADDWQADALAPAVASPVLAGADVLEAVQVEPMSDPAVSAVIEDEAVASPPAQAGDGEGEAEPVTLKPQALQMAGAREAQQITAAIQEELKVVIGLVIEAAGPELLDIMAEGEQLADAVIAQALIADALDSSEIGLLPAAVGDDGSPELAAARPILDAAPVGETFAEPAAATSPGRSSAETAAVDVPFAEAQMRTIAPLPPGVPYAIAQYLPAADLPDEDETIRVNRVDPVDDEEQDQDGRQENAPDGDQPGETPAEPEAAEKPIEEMADEIGAAADNVETAQRAAFQPRALPMPELAETMSEPAYNFYRRMAGWE